MVIDPLTGKEDKGERYVPTAQGPKDVFVNLERYLYAQKGCVGKTVLDMGCGSGFGTYLYGLVAKSVTGVDMSDDALDYARRYPHDLAKVRFRKVDVEIDALETSGFPLKPDVMVAFEFLEHIDDPARLLARVEAKELFFSLPLRSLAVSKFHKYRIDTMDDVKALIEPFYTVTEYITQDGRYIYGHGTRK